MSLKKVSSGEIIEFKGNKKGIIINIKNPLESTRFRLWYNISKNIN